MRFRPLTWSSTLAAMMTTLMLAGPAGAVPAASALKPSVQFHDPDGDVLAIDVDIERSGADATLYPLVWGRGTNLSGRVEFAVDKMTIYLDKPLGKSIEQVTIVHYGKGGQGVDSTPAGAAAFYVEPIEVADSKRRLIVKAWPVGTHTRLGVWGHDKGDGKWKHYVTFDSPTDYALLADGTFSAAANDRKDHTFMDTMGVFNGWKRYAGSSWYPMQSAAAFKIGTDATKDQFIVSDPGVLKLRELSVAQSDLAPDLKLPEITSVRATTDLNTTWVDWETHDKAGPQYHYTVELLDAEDKPVHTDEGVGPHVRRVAFEGVDATYLWARVTLTNLLDAAGRSKTVKIFHVPQPETVTLKTPPMPMVPYVPHYLEIGSAESKNGDALRIGNASNPQLAQWQIRPLAAPFQFEVRSAVSGRCATLGRGPSSATLIERPCVGQSFFLINHEALTQLIPWALIEDESALLRDSTLDSVTAFYGAVHDTPRCIASLIGVPRLDICRPSLTDKPSSTTLWFAARPVP